jgi:hypothetical protein
MTSICSCSYIELLWPIKWVRSLIYAHEISRLITYKNTSKIENNQKKVPIMRRFKKLKPITALGVIALFSCFLVHAAPVEKSDLTIEATDASISPKAAAYKAYKVAKLAAAYEAYKVAKAAAQVVYKTAEDADIVLYDAEKAAAVAVKEEENIKAKGEAVVAEYEAKAAKAAKAAEKVAVAADKIKGANEANAAAAAKKAEVAVAAEKVAKAKAAEAVKAVNEAKAKVEAYGTKKVEALKALIEAKSEAAEKEKTAVESNKSYEALKATDEDEEVQALDAALKAKKEARSAADKVNEASEALDKAVDALAVAEKAEAVAAKEEANAKNYAAAKAKEEKKALEAAKAAKVIYEVSKDATDEVKKAVIVLNKANAEAAEARDEANKAAIKVKEEVALAVKAEKAAKAAAKAAVYKVEASEPALAAAYKLYEAAKSQNIGTKEAKGTLIGVNGRVIIEENQVGANLDYNIAVLDEQLSITSFGVTNQASEYTASAEGRDGWTGEFLTKEQWDDGFKFNSLGSSFTTANLARFESLFGLNEEAVAWFWINSTNSDTALTKRDGIITNVFKLYGAVAASEFVTFSGSELVSKSYNVPEPSILLILALGMMGLAVRRFNKQS